MLGPRLSARPLPKPALRARRPPDEYIDLLSRSESEFVRFVQQLEQNPVFTELLQQGVISRVKFRGRLPREKYEEYMDREFFRFLDTFGIVNVPGWDKDFLSDTALNHVNDLAKKYKVPEGTLIRFLRYLRSTSSEVSRSSILQLSLSSNSGDYGTEATYPSGFSNPTDFVESESRVDISDVIATAQGFVEKFGLSEQDFLNDILSGELSAQEISDLYHCSVRESEEIFAVAEQINFVESYESAVESHPSPPPAASNSGSAADSPIAFVRCREDGSVGIEFDGDSVYVQRYRIRLKSLDDPRDVDRDPVVRELIDRARFINQRMSVLSRIIVAICERQRPFLTTGNAIELRPLSQADIARDLKEHQSTVSRVIRNKTLGTTFGNFPLTYLCQGKTDVIARLVEANPDKPDIKILDILVNDYQCRIARRTVAYHRGKRTRRKPSSPMQPPAQDPLS